MTYRYVAFSYLTPNGYAYKGVEVYPAFVSDEDISQELREDLELWAVKYWPPATSLASFLAKCSGAWEEISENEFHKLEQMWE